MAENDSVSKLETTFDGLMVRLLDLTGGLVAHLNELASDTSTRSEAEQVKFNQCMTKVRGDDAKVKGCMRGLYAVFVDALGHYTDVRKEKDILATQLDQRSIELEETSRRQLQCEQQIVTTLEEVRALPTDANHGERLGALLIKVQQQMDDNTGWQKRVHRLSAEITSLQDNILMMKQAETDLMFRNDALKAELCGRIQQVQMMERGMSNPTDPRFKMYTRILCEIEQNSMKAYSQHARKMSELGRASIVRKASDTAVSPGPPAGARVYRRTVSLQRLDDGYGVTIAGGDKTEAGGQNPAIVQLVRPGGAADQSGQIFKRDVITSINGKALSSFSEHSEIVQAIKGSTRVTFELQSHVAVNAGPPPLSPAQPQAKGAAAPATPEDAPPTFAVGDRVSVKGYACPGTVRFVGWHHDQTKGWRVMVELDEPLGRNDGTIDGHSYCQLKPKHGIFVRPTKVALASEPGGGEQTPAVAAPSGAASQPALWGAAGGGGGGGATPNAGAPTAPSTPAPLPTDKGTDSTLQNITNAPSEDAENVVPYPAWMRAKFGEAS